MTSRFESNLPYCNRHPSTHHQIGTVQRRTLKLTCSGQEDTLLFSSDESPEDTSVRIKILREITLMLQNESVRCSRNLEELDEAKARVRVLMQHIEASFEEERLAGEATEVEMALLVQLAVEREGRARAEVEALQAEERAQAAEVLHPAPAVGGAPPGGYPSYSRTCCTLALGA